MLEVCSMLSHNAAASGTLHCESYVTTPHSTGSESSVCKINVKKDVATTEDADLSAPPSASDLQRREREGARSAPASHFSPQVSQNLTESLLDNSEQWSLDDAFVFESSVFDDWSEAASGWKVVVPYPKYVTQPRPARVKSEPTLKRGSIHSRKPVRCVNEDWGSEHLVSAWKSNVEPVTYRYIPNNGYYRNNKNNSDVKEWLDIKKSKSEKFKVTPEVRQAQKTLKRDLEHHFKVPPEEVQAALQVQEMMGKRHESAVFRGQGDVAREPDIKTLQHNSNRLHPREQQLNKSASDLFMDNFNTRLNALEKEINMPYGPVQVHKKPADPHHCPTHLSKKLKEVRIPETMKPTIQSTKHESNNFGDDLFTIIPCKPEVPLRPLEKLTPKHKQMESSASRDRSPSPVMLSQDGEEEDGDDLMIMLAAATTQPTLRKDSTSCSINTARSAIAISNFDIDRMRNNPYQAGPSAIFRGAMRYTVNNNNSRGADMAAVGIGEEATNRERCIPAPMERRIEKELADGGYGGSLPEISGKRLTVTTSTHRLL